jgi:ribosome biogenesis protein MAK21
MYLNLLHRALKADLNSRRVQAFAKRLLQVASLSSPPFAIGIICVIRALESQFPSIRTMINSPEEDDEEEHYVDVDSDAAGEMATDAPADSSRPRYDGRKRDPAFTNADRSCLWDIIALTKHYHPTCSLYARALLHPDIPEAQDLAPTTDPANHTLSHFLDRFAYRNPKTSEKSKEHGSSIMQPLAGAKRADMLFRPAGEVVEKGLQPVNTAAFWEAKARAGKEDVAFFQAYFEKAGKGPSKADKKKKKRGEDGEEDEDEIWQALVKSRPEIEGDDDTDDGFDEEDIDWEDDSDEGEPVLGEDGEDVDMDEDGQGDEGVQLVGFSDDDLDANDQDEDGQGDDDFPELESADEDAMFNSDDDVPEPEPQAKDKEEKPKKRRKLKHLPMFASVDDYAKMLEDEDDGM